MNFDNLKEKFFSLFKKDKRILVLFIISIVAVFLMIFSECSPSKETVNTKKEFDIDSYVKQTQEKITKIVQMIDGAGKCEVMITPERTIEYVYFQEETLKTDTHEEDSLNSSKQTIKTETQTAAAFIDSNSKGKEALVTTTIMPKIAGVVVICEGGGNSVVQERVINAVATALNIEQSRVYVTKKQR